MIKYRDSHDFLIKAVGIDRLSFMFIDTTAAIIVFLTQIFKKEITRNIFKLIIPLTILAIWWEIYFIISLMRLDFAFDKGKLMATTVATLVLACWGWKWFPYWEDGEIV